MVRAGAGVESGDAGLASGLRATLMAARRRFAGLGIAWKLALAALYFVTPVGYLVAALVSEQNLSVDFARRELAGTKCLRELLALGAEIGTDRAAAFRRLAEIRDHHPEFPGFRDSLDGLGAALAAQAPGGEAAAVAAFRRSAAAVGDDSNLILDPQIDSYYVIDASLVVVPSLIERTVGLAAAEGNRAAANRAVGALDTDLESLGHTIARAEATTSDPRLRAILDPAYGQAMAAASDLRAAAVAGPVDGPATTRALAAFEALETATVTATDALLQARIDALEAKRLRIWVASILLFLPGIGIIWLGAVQGVIRPVARITRAIHGLADGDLSTEVPHADRADEIGDLAHSMTVFRANAQRQQILEAERIEWLEDRDRRQQARIEETTTQLDDTFRSIGQGVWLLDSTGRVITVNRRAAELVGLPETEIGPGRTAEEVGPLIAARMIEGFVFPTLGGTPPRDYPTRDGRWLEIRANPAESGGAVVLVSDVTRRKRDEIALRDAKEEAEAAFDRLEAAQGQLVESEKMAALGSLVAGVAHEINTPIGVGLTAASSIGDRLKSLRRALDTGKLSRDELDSYCKVSTQGFEILLANLGRAAELVGSFKKIAVDQHLDERCPVALTAYIRETVLSLAHETKQRGRKVLVEGPEDLVVELVPAHVWQVVSNLVLNANIHAFGDAEGGTIRIAIGRQARHATIEIADDGIGMPEDVRRHCFEPFFTTRRGRGGSGLGLAIVYNLVAGAMGGKIEVASAPGKGTVFSIGLPMGRV